MTMWFLCWVCVCAYAFLSARLHVWGTVCGWVLASARILDGYICWCERETVSVSKCKCAPEEQVSFLKIWNRYSYKFDFDQKKYPSSRYQNQIRISWRIKHRSITQVFRLQQSTKIYIKTMAETIQQIQGKWSILLQYLECCSRESLESWLALIWAVNSFIL